jgi:hypothetical protein
VRAALAALAWGINGCASVISAVLATLAAINAIQLLDPVQLGEMTPVHNNEGGSTDTLYAPDQKSRYFGVARRQNPKAATA